MLTRKRYCDECKEEINQGEPFIATEGIYIDGVKDEEDGIDIANDEDFCCPDCLYAFVRSKFQSCVNENKFAEKDIV